MGYMILVPTHDKLKHASSLLSRVSGLCVATLGVHVGSSQWGSAVVRPCLRGADMSKNLSESVFFVVYFGGWFNVGKVHVSTRYARVFTRRRKVDNSIGRSVRETFLQA